jgi:sortase A
MARQLLGNALLVAGLIGFAATLALPRAPAAVLEPIEAVVGEAPQPPPPARVTDPEVSAAAASETHAVTRLVIDSIQLDTPVSPAPLVEHDGVTTWDVPRFVAGYAEGSAGAGQPGNSILIGHVTSLTLGNVFERLHEVSPDDLVLVFHGDTRFAYTVGEVHDVARTDVDVLGSTPSPTLTLITCSGAWLPTIRDYSQRLVVRAELIH